MTRIAFRSSWAAFFFFLLAISVEAKRCIQFPTIAPPQNILQPAVLPHAQQSLLGQPCRLPSTPNGPSSCGLGLYCSIYTLTCLPQRDTGSPCRSSTLCLSGSCEHTTCSSRPPPSSHHALLLTKRDNGQNFSTVHDHSTAFNVIHLIIVIVGIAMASIVGLVAFVLFRRRRKANNSDLEKAAMQSTQRFNAFQQVFFLDSSADDNIRPAETARLRTSDQTPLMQQQQLHWQLLEQQRRKAPLPQQQQDFVAPPPPPYHP